MSKKNLLCAKNLTKIFHMPHSIEVLSDINFALAPAESVAIVGPSGSGKSTLLSILGTLEEPTAGTLNYFDEEITDIARLRSHHIGFIFQSQNLLEEYSLIDNLLIRAKLAGKTTHPKSDSYVEAVGLLKHVHLLERIQHPAKLLSGGEKQRAALARALMNSPDIIFADEPTGNLDEENNLEIQNLLFTATQESGKSLVLVTHDANFAKRCDRTLHLQNGVLEIL